MHKSQGSSWIEHYICGLYQLDLDTDAAGTLVPRAKVGPGEIVIGEMTFLQRALWIDVRRKLNEIADMECDLKKSMGDGSVEAMNVLPNEIARLTNTRSLILDVLRHEIEQEYGKPDFPYSYGFREGFLVVKCKSAFASNDLIDQLVQAGVYTVNGQPIDAYRWM